MDLIKYYKQLSEDSRQAYADRVPTTVNYLRNHIMKERPAAIKGASLPFMKSLSAASNGSVTLGEVVSHFDNRKTYSGSQKQKAVNS